MNFSDVPQSIGELRAEKERDSSAWTVRDMLVSMLRDIDSGAQSMPERAVIVFQRIDPTDGLPVSGYWIAGAPRTTALGMLETAKLLIWDGGK